MNDKWTEKLSDYLDGELSAAEGKELETHLSGCDECAATLEQLRQVVSRAQALEDRPPVSDLWAGIAERIGVAEPVTDLGTYRERKQAPAWRRRLSFSLPQLAAASIVLMAVSAGAAWMVIRTIAPASDSGALTVNPGAGTMAPAFTAATSYDAAVGKLEQILEESRDQLDTATVRIIEENLMVIDRAIAQAQRALAQDPASIYLQEHLATTMRQKLELLRRAAQIAGTVS